MNRNLAIFLNLLAMTQSLTVLQDSASRNLTNIRNKRAIREHYSDLHCMQKFETSEQTIIRTVESQNNGAVFLNVSTVVSFEICLATCCETQLCNVAIFDREVRSFL